MRRNVYNSPNIPNGNQDPNSNDGTGGLPTSPNGDGTGGLPESWQQGSPSPSDNPPPRLTAQQMREQQRIEYQIREDRRRPLEASNGQAGGTEQRWGNGAGAFARVVRPRFDLSLNPEPRDEMPVDQDTQPIGNQNDMGQEDARSRNVNDQENLNELAMNQTTTQTEVRSIFQEQMQIHNQAMQQHQQEMQQHHRAMQQHQQAMQDTNQQTQRVLDETREILHQIQEQANRSSTPIDHINLQGAPSTPPNQIVPIRLTHEQIQQNQQINRNAENMGMIPRGPKEDQSGNEEGRGGGKGR